MNKPRIAFFGLGIMGSGMARRLLVNGFPLTVFNRNAEKAKPFAAEGAHVASLPRKAAARAKVILSMVADDNASRSLWLGENGALTAAKPGTVCVECSTVTVGWIHELAAAAQGKKCELLDAPVTGSKTQAASGELNFLVGGAAGTLEKVRPVLAAMSKSVIPIGPVGSGARLKLINNFVCAVQVAALAEAIAMIERSGLDRAKALELLAHGAPGSPLVKAVSARMTTPDFTPNFRLRLMAKDLGYAIAEAGNNPIDLATAKAALAVFQKGVTAGQGDKDIAAVVEQFRKSRFQNIMSVQPVLLAGQWRAASANGNFHAENPATGERLPDEFPVSTWVDCDDALNAAAGAANILRGTPPERVARFLTRFAERIKARAAEIVATANLESGLPKAPRLAEVELPRTTGQLRQAAAAALEGSWAMPVIDAKLNIRSMLAPVGPVWVFGPNNFPLAFNSVSGGDFAAAIAAGNPVIAKANTSHPGTSRLLAEEAFATVTEAGLPPATVQLIYRTTHADGERLVADPRTGATGYTGSRRAGLKLKAAKDEVGKPIYVELSSVNPVLMLPGALAERGAKLAEEYTGSCLMGTGQFCTSPSFVVLFARDAVQAAQILDQLEGNLTGCIYSDTTGKDDALYDQLVPHLRPRVGRLLNDKMPAGVAVSPAMNHGGPFPATGHPGFTAVGIPASLRRFGMLACYDNIRPARLPASLPDKNPNGKMWRLIDGNWTQSDVIS